MVFSWLLNLMKTSNQKKYITGKAAKNVIPGTACFSLISFATSYATVPLLKTDNRNGFRVTRNPYTAVVPTCE
jgi:hypothetical protein